MKSQGSEIKINEKIFGEVIPNLTINGKSALYPVVDEKVVRAMAGISLAIASIGFNSD